MSWMTLVGAGIGAIGAMQSGEAEKKAYNQRAEESDRVARDIEISGAQQEQEMKYQAGIVKGQQEAGAASGGVSGGGSVLELLQETNRRDKMNIANLRYNVASQAYGKRAESTQSRFAGKVAQRRGYIQGLTAITQGVGMMAAPTTPATLPTASWTF